MVIFRRRERAAGNRGLVALTVSALLLGVGAGVVIPPEPASAAPIPSQFDPGNIITDANFYDGDAMTEAQIQAFLVSKGSGLATYRSTVSSRAVRPSVDIPGHVYCQAFNGGSDLLASTIIYRAQAACGVSARALLVTLQKEQGLITKAYPTAGELKIAMGYGCPDTAPCDSLYYGFGNQIYMASLQFRFYQRPENNYRYRVGNVFVQYHPNAACSGTTVAIKNWATAALYNYTPYQPNSAALNSYPGIGDGCSSYGNRNFWFQYHNWFGNPLAASGAAAIEAAYEASGGAAGPLGAATSALNCGHGAVACSQQFERGYVGWTIGAGAHVVSGAIGASYKERGGPGGVLGQPLSAVSSFETDNGTGQTQIFQGGYLYSSGSGVFRVVSKTPLEAAWIAEGWIRGQLGWPVSEKNCDAKGCAQEFQGGFIGGPTDSSAFVVSGVFKVSYKERGGPSGLLGYPTTSVNSFDTDNGSGQTQVFQGGYLYSSTAGVFRVASKTPLEAAWIAEGWVRGPLGWPVSEKLCDANGCAQEFQGGFVGGTSTDAAIVVSGALADSYRKRGGPGGELHYPTGPLNSFDTDNGSGVVQVFQGGYLYSSAAGVFRVVPKTTLERAWIAEGWVRGPLGWPIADEVCSSGNCSQQFQGGVINAQTGAISFGAADPAISAYWTSRGGSSGALGNPTGPATRFSTVNGDGVVQTFQGGYLYSSKAGVFHVVPKTKLEAEWISQGWIRGVLGWPESERVCSSGVCEQRFQGGTISDTGAVSFQVVDPAIAAYWNGQGGEAGPLGKPIGPATAFQTVNGDGNVQVFRGGYLYSSAAGVFQVAPKAKLEAAWIGQGWIRGSLGWPTSNESCTAGICSQRFQGGTLTR